MCVTDEYQQINKIHFLAWHCDCSSVTTSYQATFGLARQDLTRYSDGTMRSLYNGVGYGKGCCFTSRRTDSATKLIRKSFSRVKIFFEFFSIIFKGFLDFFLEITGL